VGRPFLLRFAALAAFLVTVALALWLAELSPLYVGIVMGVALLLAWTAEWVAWREEHRPGDVQEEEAATDTEAAAEVEAGAELEPAVGLEAAWQPEAPDAAEAASPPPLRSVVPAAPAEPTPPAPAEPPKPAPAPLRPVPHPPEPPPPEPVAAPPPADTEPERAAVVTLPRRPGRQEWNLWEIERLVRDQLRDDPERLEESQYLLLHLRSFASADGSLPTEFDDLVRESFGAVLQHA
jgi:outer membrane biosynthesis protein TonB